MWGEGGERCVTPTLDYERLMACHLRVHTLTSHGPVCGTDDGGYQGGVPAAHRGAYCIVVL